MDKINLSAAQITQRFRIEVQKFNDRHLRNMAREVLVPELFGTERCDLMASTMYPHTELAELDVQSILHWEIAKQAAARFCDSIKD